MSFTSLIDNVPGVEPKEFFDVVVEEINQKGIPNIQYDWKTESATNGDGGLMGMGSTKTEALVLRAFDTAHQSSIMCFSYGNALYVSASSQFSKKVGNSWQSLSHKDLTLISTQ